MDGTLGSYALVFLPLAILATIWLLWCRRARRARLDEERVARDLNHAAVETEVPAVRSAGAVQHAGRRSTEHPDEATGPVPADGLPDSGGAAALLNRQGHNGHAAVAVAPALGPMSAGEALSTGIRLAQHNYLLLTTTAAWVIIPAYLIAVPVTLTVSELADPAWYILTLAHLFAVAALVIACVRLLGFSAHLLRRARSYQAGT